MQILLTNSSDAKSKEINNEQVLHESMNGEMSIFLFLLWILDEAKTCDWQYRLIAL